MYAVSPLFLIIPARSAVREDRTKTGFSPLVLQAGMTEMQQEAFPPGKASCPTYAFSCKLTLTRQSRMFQTILLKYSSVTPNCFLRSLSKDSNEPLLSLSKSSCVESFRPLPLFGSSSDLYRLSSFQFGIGHAPQRLKCAVAQHYPYTPLRL